MPQRGRGRAPRPANKLVCQPERLSARPFHKPALNFSHHEHCSRLELRPARIKLRVIREFASGTSVSSAGTGRAQQPAKPCKTIRLAATQNDENRARAKRYFTNFIKFYYILLHSITFYYIFYRLIYLPEESTCNRM